MLVYQRVSQPSHQESLNKLVDLVTNLRLRHAPDASIDLEMTAVAYTDWDADSAKLGRPVVAAFGGKDGGEKKWELEHIDEHWWEMMLYCMKVLSFYLFVFQIAFPRWIFDEIWV